MGQFFRLLDAVAMPRGCVRLGEGTDEYTRYTCCCSTERGRYYYKTYESGCVAAVDLNRTDLEGRDVLCFPLVTEPQILEQN